MQRSVDQKLGDHMAKQLLSGLRCLGPGLGHLSACSLTSLTGYGLWLGFHSLPTLGFFTVWWLGFPGLPRQPEETTWWQSHGHHFCCSVLTHTVHIQGWRAGGPSVSQTSVTPLGSGWMGYPPCGPTVRRNVGLSVR